MPKVAYLGEQETQNCEVLQYVIEALLDFLARTLNLILT